MPLTWWLQADLHFNEEDQFQQNLSLTLQAMAMEKKENKVKILIHKEIEPDVNIIFESQIGTWLLANMIKVACFSTGKGDILFRLLCSTSANSFLLAEIEGKKLKIKLEEGIYHHFGLCLSATLVRVAVVGIQGDSVPKIGREDIEKPLILFVSTEERTKFEEIEGDYETESLYHLQDYSTEEVTDVIEEFYSEEEGILTPESPEGQYSIGEMMGMFNE